MPEKLTPSNDGQSARVNAERLWQLVNPPRVARLLHHDLQQFRLAMLRRVPDAAAKLFKPAAQISNGYLVGEVDSGAAFDLTEKREMVVNAEAIRMMLRTIAAISNDEETAASIAGRLIECFIVHETIHVGQNLARFDQVQELKRVASSDLLGTLDLLADYDAARFVSALAIARHGISGRKNRRSREQFLWELLNTLFAMTEIAPRTFKSPADKPHKRRRFLGIALSAQLIHTALKEKAWAKFESEHFSLETPLYVYTDEITGAIVVFAPETSRIVGRTSIAPQELFSLLAELDCSPSATIMNRVSIIADAIALGAQTTIPAEKTG